MDIQRVVVMLELAVVMLGIYSTHAAAAVTVPSSTTALPATCTTAVTAVDGVDMTPTAPADYGKCTPAMESKYLKMSDW